MGTRRRYGCRVRTVGIDLSAEARGTGIAVVDWSGGSARLATLQVGAHDRTVLAALDRADRAAIDCPLGWPEPFIDFLNGHRAGRAPAPVGPTGLQWRRTLSRRATDLHVAEALPGAVPLAVAADRIAAVAMRAAGLLAALADAGRPVDRAGSGLLVEVYPAAALRAWGLTSRSYKGSSNRPSLGLLVDELQAAVPALDWQGHDRVCRESDDALDAVVCALLARAAHLRLTAGPPEHLAARAATEGWIHLPKPGSLSQLTP
jgi:predicted nuclease with RNAse H fold